ncbi:MAG: hypothetical protein ACO1NS_12610 [Daejeonella sp.]
MKNHFSSKRFALLFNKHTSEHLGTFSMAVMVLFGILLSIVLFFSLTGSALVSVKFQQDIFFLFLFIAGTVFTSNDFVDLGNKKKASIALMLPASHFEKFLIAWIFSFLALAIVYVGIFYLVMFVASSVMQLQGKVFEIYNLTTDPISTAWIFLIFMALHSIAYAGSVYFERLHYVKTALVFFGMLMLVIVLNKSVVALILNNDVMTPLPFFRASVMENGERFFLDITKRQRLLLMSAPVLFAVALWTAAYYRLKEKEI